jgi:hypothetical protein
VALGGAVAVSIVEWCRDPVLSVPLVMLCGAFHN